MTRGREQDQLKWIQVQLFKVLTEVVEENPVDGCCGDNEPLESILLKGPEKVYTSMHENLFILAWIITIFRLYVCMYRSAVTLIVAVRRLRFKCWHFLELY